MTANRVRGHVCAPFLPGAAQAIVVSRLRNLSGTRRARQSPSFFLVWFIFFALPHLGLFTSACGRDQGHGCRATGPHRQVPLVCTCPGKKKLEAWPAGRPDLCRKRLVKDVFFFFFFPPFFFFFLCRTCPALKLGLGFGLARGRVNLKMPIPATKNKGKN